MCNVLSRHVTVLVMMPFFFYNVDVIMNSDIDGFSLGRMTYGM